VKVGDLVSVLTGNIGKGLIVGFNKRGEGGKHFVHVLSDNKVNIIFYIDIEVISSC
jgi:hypothetical protein|tara:strand:- start:813 stop:980 length:168 start_codon:yes stop_codon:yes gene_type:complete